jgi:pilus assembly protein Flp/PilA
VTDNDSAHILGFSDEVICWGMRRTGWEHMTTLIRFLNDKSAATAVEYGLLASLISVGMLVGLGAFSDSLLAVFQTITTAMTGAGGA